MHSRTLRVYRCIALRYARTPVDEMQAATAAERSRAPRTFEARDRGNRSLDRFSRPPRVHYLWRLFTPRAHAAHVISPREGEREQRRERHLSRILSGERGAVYPPSLPSFRA